MNSKDLLAFLKIAEKLKCHTRHSWTSTGRHESVAEHSWRLAMMAYLVKGEFPGTDIDKVIRMCLFHDIGEAVTGDIPSFNKKDIDRRTEAQAVDDILATLPEPYRRELTGLFAEMNGMATPEARLYKALDKLEAVEQHNEADISTWLPLEYQLNLEYGAAETAFSEYLEALRRAMNEESRQKISGQGTEACADIGQGAEACAEISRQRPPEPR